MNQNNIVGLCMTYKGTNYGQLLQAYALQQVVKGLGYSTEIIDYTSGKNKGLKLSYATIYVSLNQIRSLVKNRFSNNINQDDLHKKNIQMRKKVSDKFREDRLTDIVKCNGFSQLRENSKKYASVIVGSDQIWIPSTCVTNFYTLRFAAKGVNRISYATSMGVSSYPKYAKKMSKDYWRKINYLSVREDQARKIIHEIAGVEATVVADPTYLLTQSEWNELIPESKVIEGKYILCYFLGDNTYQKNYARYFSKIMNLPLISILSNECVSDDSEFADEVLIGKSPEEFLNLIRNAEYILTDSFHGVAFSVIFEKQFYVFYRNRTDVKIHRNSRIDNILKKFNLQDRLITDPENFHIVQESINFIQVSETRLKFRDYSLNFKDLIK